MIAGVCRVWSGTGHEEGLELLQKLYRMETGCPLPPILVSPRGKPYFAEGEYHFSISHTKNHAFCVLAKQNVGIDAEELDRTLRGSAVHRVLSTMELEQLEQSADPRRAFLSFWVLKEAAAKLSGVGLRGFPNHTSFTLPDSRVREWEGCLVAILAEDDNEGVTTYAF